MPVSVSVSLKRGPEVLSVVSTESVIKCLMNEWNIYFSICYIVKNKIKRDVFLLATIPTLG